MSLEEDASDEAEMRTLLDFLLENDIDITAREVTRRHSRLKAASSVTRSASRRTLLEEFKGRQLKYRDWARRSAKSSPERLTELLAQKDIKIQDLEKKVQILTASHVAMIRAVGIVGGFPKWTEFFEHYELARSTLASLGALPVD